MILLISAFCHDPRHTAKGIAGPGNVVADETESRYSRIRLHDPSQRGLSILSHRIRFVQDDELIRWAGICLAIATRPVSHALLGRKRRRLTKRYQRVLASP